MLIRRCSQRPFLLTEEADRFFITPHYGDPTEPGAVLTRLSENTENDLGELAELLADAWREVAPKKLVAEWDVRS